MDDIEKDTLFHIIRNLEGQIENLKKMLDKKG